VSRSALIAELVRRHLAGETLAVHHPLGGRRFLVEIWQTDTGFVFADLGWWDSEYSGHPFHRIDGEATAGDDGDVTIALSEEDAGGTTATARVYAVRPYERSGDPAACDAARWLAYRASPEGRRYPGRAFALRHAREIDPTARL
jgi:hypothetical protein